MCTAAIQVLSCAWSMGKEHRRLPMQQAMAHEDAQQP